ncbi:MAG: alpha-L-fucosidase [Sphingobacteriaceae bacterium]|nr:alpha-L-fucosidase [Sphingobacteriaceae bacterium]
MVYIKKIVVVFVFFTLAFCALAQTQPYEGVPGWTSTKDRRMEWFKEARFGMFIHWGLYSAAEGYWKNKKYTQHYAEWIQNWAGVSSTEYAAVLKPKFTAAKFKPRYWAKLAKEAGMRYMVLTARHHEGFTLYNSKEPYAINNSITGGTNISPKGRDLYGETIAAFKDQGLKTGAYYSLLDWQHPDSYHTMGRSKSPGEVKPEHQVYKNYLYNQIRELSTNYGKMDVLWVDFSAKNNEGEAWGTKRILTDLIKWQPDVIINNRFWDGLENKNGDIGTPEKYIPSTGLPGMDWEVNHTINESYGYSAHDKNWKSYDKMMRLFLETVSKGGNFLLNIGPDREGSIPDTAVNILRQIGEWMKVNKEAIYGTTASPFQKMDWGFCTQKPGKLYLEVFDMPKDGQIKLPLSNRINSAYALKNRDAKLNVSNLDKAKAISLPNHFKGKLPMVIVLEITGKPEVSLQPGPTKNTNNIVLLANQAELRNEKGIKKGINDGGVNPSWIDINDYLTWDLKIQKPGKYKVLIQYRTKEPIEGTWGISLDKTNFEMRINEDTPGNKQKDVGVLTVSQNAIGMTSLTLEMKLISLKSDSMIELSNITLIPL